jgi:peptide-methionine (R)-S-oxide reductase
MFDSLDNVTSKRNLGRREFMAAGAAAGLTLAYGWLRRPKLVEAVASQPADKSGQVKIVQFSDDGKRLQTVQLAKVVKTEAEWQKQLTPAAFDITRHADTELAFSGQYWNLHEKGLFRCICCDNALFSSETKFDSGTGWPSFWQPIAPENVRTSRDMSLGMIRDAVSCTLCDAHLGHVFDDGPRPTGLRYCMNSASLRFVKRV